MSAQQAARYLGVKPATLYAYVSRGLVTSAPAAAGRARSYLTEDLVRLKTRHDARRGHAAVAAGALRFGEPVLETRISHIGPQGPEYRGRPLLQLLGELGFEAAAELLWAAAPAPWPPVPRLAMETVALLRRVPRPLERLTLAVPLLALGEPDRHAQEDPLEHRRARRLIAGLFAAHLAPSPASRRAQAERAGSLAEALLLGLRGRAARDEVEAMDRALVLCADHELNASTFAARVAASTGADLFACLTAAVAALSGPRHGAACDRVEALVGELGRSGKVAASLRARVQRGEVIPGFGHPLYRAGDPRAPPLLEMAQALAPRSPRVRVALSMARAMREAGRGEPTLDLGLVALADALHLPEGTGSAIFALGRSAGWVAHVLEQRRSPLGLRPRARYVGGRAPDSAK